MKARWRTDAVEWNATVLDSLNHLQYYRDTQWQECTPKKVNEYVYEKNDFNTRMIA